MNNLEMVLVGGNQLTSLSSTMFEKMNNLKVLIVADNQIHSPFPNLSQCKKLQTVQLYNNLFYGHTDENMFNQMPDLYYFDVHSNMIEGKLPAFIDSPNLELFDIRSNLFSGLIPSSWQYFTSLETFLGDHNLIESPIAILGGLNTLIDLSLSHNFLTTSVGDLVNDGDACMFVASATGSSLLRIDLSYNHLDGMWTDNANLQNIQTINVAHNQIEQFPTGFLVIALSLSSFDISYNNLQGSFPDLDIGAEPLRTLSCC
jgi:Leucine-rich repeat (LRR) protein